MIVELDHFRSKASAWSVSGFSLETAVPGLNLGDVRSAHVLLRISDVDLGFDIPCQVTGESEIGAAEFEFLGAFTEPAALLLGDVVVEERGAVLARDLGPVHRGVAVADQVGRRGVVAVR